MIERTPYWLDTAARQHTTGHDLPAQVDVAVIGGGLTGLSAAIHLSRKGASVALLERGTLGSGASGRNGGMCTTGATVGFGTLLKRYGADTAARLFLAYNDAIDLVESLVEQESIDCHFKRWGKLVLAAKPEHVERFEADRSTLAQHLGHETHVISRADLESEVNSERYYGGHLDPKGAGLHVGKFVMGLARVASRLGATLHEHANVVSMSRSANGHVLQTSAGRLSASQVLVATNGYTDRALPYFRRRVVPVRAASIVTEPLSDALAQALMPTGRMATDTSNLITYFRLTPDNRVLIGGRAAYGFSESRSDRASSEMFRSALAEIFPGLRDVRVDYAWSGLTGFTLDRIPHAGERDGVFYAMGYCGHGVQMATYMGRQMADVMDGKPDANPWRQFRFRSIPLYFGRPWFLPLSDTYFKIKDRIS
jgi:glycine/D-amino acid oxidase-like deaminating enzyme